MIDFNLFFILKCFFFNFFYLRTWEGIEGPIFQFGEVRNGNEVVYSNEHNRLCALIGRKTLNLDETLFMELFNETKKQKPKQSVFFYFFYYFSINEKNEKRFEFN